MPTLALNRKARSEYEFLEEFEGGLVLTGPEVKSAKGGHIQLKGAFLTMQKGELWLKNAYIAPYKPAGDIPYNPNADRKVLVHKQELAKISEKKAAQGLTIVPISVYTKHNFIKLGFALAKGKKKYEKRESKKQADIKRTIAARMKGDRHADM